MPVREISFRNAAGQALAGVLHAPAGRPIAGAVFAHCFTCGKDNPAARAICEELAYSGVAALRFDFAGVAKSEGSFAQTGFSSNVGDIVAAADHLRGLQVAPALLIGHSFGGTAMLAAAERIADAKAVVTIGAPYDPAHLLRRFRDKVAEIEERGAAQVALAGHTLTLSREFLDDISDQRLGPKIRNLQKALLILHSPTDQEVGIENATQIFRRARHPKSFITLAEADHLLSRESDARYAAQVIAAWASRYIADPAAAAREKGIVEVTEAGAGTLQQSIAAGAHFLVSDEPVSAGGGDRGPSPYDLLLSALGACTAMTLRLYAARKNLPLRHVAVELTHKRLHASDDEAVRQGKPRAMEKIERIIRLEGDLTKEQRGKLMEIAEKCPVHRTLTHPTAIVTTEPK